MFTLSFSCMCELGWPICGYEVDHSRLFGGSSVGIAFYHLAKCNMFTIDLAHHLIVCKMINLEVCKFNPINDTFFSAAKCYI
jgi:hypothetical protein